MIISSYNEWDPLREIVVGSATHANWPVNDPVFSQEASKTLWKETPVPSGPVPQWIIDEANEDLQTLADTLTGLGVKVHRPWDYLGDWAVSDRGYDPDEMTTINQLMQEKYPGPYKVVKKTSEYGRYTYYEMEFKSGPEETMFKLKWS